VGVPVGLIMAMVMGAGKNSSEDGIVLVQALLQLVFYAGALFLNIFFVGKFGATPGKMACGLRIVRSDGSKVSYGRATGRAFAEIVSGMVCYIGFIMAAFDDEKRTLHDRMVDTRVIKK
ncbi:MAG TPA: RDD family protein, partial [Roseimicrobium sp.]|nr:RDD family protein [Roseimicrobium sp.]